MNKPLISRPLRQTKPLLQQKKPTGTPMGKQSQSLGTRLLLGGLTLALIPVILIALIATAASLRNTREALTQAAQEKLVVIRDAAKRQVQEEIGFLLRSTGSAAREPVVAAALRDFSAAFAKLPQDGNGGRPFTPAELASKKQALVSYYKNQWWEKFKNLNGGQSLEFKPFLSALSDAGTVLQHDYIVKNSFGEGSRDRLDVKDGSSYSIAYQQYFQSLQNLASRLELKGIRLINPQGMMVFSSNRDIDLGQSLLKPPLNSSPMAQAFRKALNSRSAVISDFGFYAPAFNEFTVFFAAPVYEGNKFLGVVAFDAPVSKFEALVTNYGDYEALGLGKEGDVSLIHLDSRLYLTNKRAFLQNPEQYLQTLEAKGYAKPVLEQMLTKSSVAGLLKESEEVVNLAENGAGAVINEEEIVAFDQLGLGLPWAIFAEASLSEVLQPLSRLQQKLLEAVWVVLALVLAVAGVATLLFVRSLTRPVQAIAKVVERFGRGDLSQLVPIKSSDEIGQLGLAFNNSILRLREFLAQQEEERQKAAQLQLNVQKFLSVATEIAQGDLTKRGEVSNDVLGNVVDAVNLTVEEIAHLLKGVKQAAESVNQSAAQMDQLTASIASGALLQAQEVGQVQAQTQMVTSGIRQMAQSAGLSAQAALQTLESAQLGRQAVAQTLVGMGNIRNEMQAIAENITALARRSAEIENITKVLEDFASQTNLLALNASFEAAGAGAAGRRFAIVADEIRKLAEESARETSRVNHLVQQVQSEIARVVERVQEGVREVETGYNVATSAGGRLEEIAQLAAQSAGLAQEISGLAQSQVSVVERVDQAVQKIAHTAQQTGRESQEGRQSAEAMRALAQALSQNLARFRLPS
ncbi:methyl-accepting chemotaxis protein [Meiothermus sp.]|uniref:methyl-accepting chemotaxis protein n=1 Tax=Meiothermus sp. TaxID=1955249 RepID=UPI0021DBE898|nr:methyl-accepting chemotaxis protein [Meiothermus sp.]GIW23744.1 MAG: hypothetical protein KatS3mg069_0011 [Meiothermus sp.]